MRRATARPDRLERRTMRAGGVERTYWVAAALDPKAPILFVLHGLGMTVLTMAGWTDLATPRRRRPEPDAPPRGLKRGRARRPARSRQRS